MSSISVFENTSETVKLTDPLSSPRQKLSCGDLCVVSADYTIRAEWDTAYVVDVTVVIDCDQSGPIHRSGLDGWKIEFSLAEDTKISKIWNAHLERDRTRCTVVHEKFCSSVGRGRAVLYFGFEAKPSDRTKRVPVPSSIAVNGQVCGVTASHTRELADCYYDYLFESRRSSRSPSPGPAASRTATPSRSPTPDNRDASLPPPDQQPLQISPDMFSNKRMRPSSPSPVADSRELKRNRKSLEELCSSDDEEKSTAPTPPRDFSPYAGSEVSAQILEAARMDDSPQLARCVSQSGRKRSCPDGSSHDIEHTASSSVNSTVYPRTLEIEYYRRSKALKQRKWLHMDYLDTCFNSREEVILATVLDKDSTVLEPNMFPYDTPPGVTHWTLWSKHWLTEDDMASFVNRWLPENMPAAVEWNHDDNMSDGLSINLFHVHVYIRC